MTSAAQKLPYGVDAQNKAQFTAWVAERGLRCSERGACLHWIARGGCHVPFCRETRSEHRWMDHVSGWTRDGTPALLLCQPYHLGGQDLRDLTQAAERFGLTIAVHGAGWYGNGTVAIELTRRAQEFAP